MKECKIKNFEPREYQKNIFRTAINANTLVCLPTGLGKTNVAVLLSVYRLNKFPDSKILICTPTKTLSAQIYNEFKKRTNIDDKEIVLLTGGISPKNRGKFWMDSRVIIATPQTIQFDLENGRISLENVSMLCIDECHRCLKNYSYTYVVEKYKQESKNPRILGLTASPGADKKTILQIAENLGIEAIEVRTRESDDVSPYIQKLKFEIIKLDFPEELKEIQILLRELYNKKIEELRNRKLLFLPATKKNILELQKKIMHMISTGNKNFNNFGGASACAQAIKLQYCLELLETQTITSLQRYIQNLFEQASQNKSRAVKQLIKQPKFTQAYVKTTELIARKIENPKLAKLKEIVEEEFKTSKIKRIIVFSQYRETIVKICKTLNEVQGVNARVFVGQAKKGEGKEATGLSQKEQQEILRDFGLGKINILVSSSIGEEGLDVVEVGAVIFYEPIPSAIRQIQRRGRTARLKPGKLIILMNKNTRDETYYWAAFHKERKMYKAIQDINEEFENKENNNKNSEETNKPEQKKLDI